MRWYDVVLVSRVAAPMGRRAAREGAPASASVADVRVPSVSANFVSAGLATLASRAALHPLDTLRTRAQRVPGAPPARSLLALWAGFPAACAGAAPAQAVYYSTYSALRPVVGVAPAAAAGNILAALLRVPPEIVKQRAQSGLSRSTVHAVREIISVDGPLGLWRGLWAQIRRDVPFAVVLFLVYEYLAAQERTSDMANGAIAGAAASVATAPLDLLKTRTMLGQGGYRPTIADILQREGRLALWKGVGYRILYKICSSSLFFAALEMCKRVFSGPVLKRLLPTTQRAKPLNRVSFVAPRRPSRAVAKLAFSAPFSL